MFTTVPGNYPKVANRPGGQALRRAIQEFDDGKITREDLARVADEVTIEVIQEQERAGVDLISDGQIRWEDPLTYIARGLEGFRITGLIRYFDTNTFYRQPVAQAPIRWQAPIVVRDYQFATRHATRPVKPVLTGPYTLAKLSLTEIHPDLRSFTLELAQALNQELRALQAVSPPLIQVDEPAITRAKHKGDWPLFQEAMHVLVDGITAKLVLRTDFGDLTGLPGIFDLPFAGFGLDFVMGPRNRELVPAFPKEKELVLGSVDARNVKMETEEYLHQSIRWATQYVDATRLGISPNTGLEYLPRETAYAKLENMVRAVKNVKEVAA